jgi:hypothetical protein
VPIRIPASIECGFVAHRLELPTVFEVIAVARICKAGSADRKTTVQFGGDLG